NDFATLVASALPIGVHFAVSRGWRIPRVVSIGGLIALLAAFVWADSRGGFLALLAAALVLLFGYRTVSPVTRVVVAVVLVLGFSVAAGASFWARMNTIASPGQDYNVT